MSPDLEVQASQNIQRGGLVTFIISLYNFSAMANLDQPFHEEVLQK